MKAKRNAISEETGRLQYGYRREIAAPFDETVARTREKLMNEGFGVLTEIDMKEKLKEKLDVDFRRYLILGACNPPLAQSALEEDLDIGLLLPCNVIVYENGDTTTVAAVDAAKMLTISGNSSLAETAATVNEKLRTAIDSI